MSTIQCPHCQAALRMNPAAIGKQAKCPKCGQRFQIKHDDHASLPAPIAALPKTPPSDPIPQPPVLASPPPKPIITVAATARRRRRFMRKIFTVRDFIILILTLFCLFLLFLIQRSFDYGQSPTQVWARQTLAQLALATNALIFLLVNLIFWGAIYLTIVFFTRRNPRLLRQATYHFLWLTPAVLLMLPVLLNLPLDEPRMSLGTAMAFIVSGGLAGLWLYFTRYWFEILAPKLASLFIKTAICPGCEAELSLIGQWNCSCGYHDHRQRHLMRFRCPLCSSYTGHINCPHCDVTILA